jgi:hypothetical protein
MRTQSDLERDARLPQVWSCGGGTQSAAIAALIIQGRLPKPDIAVMVDTMRERTSTWSYVYSVLIPQLATVGVTLEIVSKDKYATVDLWGGADGNTLLIPAFTNQNGRIGKLSTFCSTEWKVRVRRRWLRDQHGIRKAVTWLGISVDEQNRVRTEPNTIYPLIHDVPMRRAGCIILAREMGWPEPPKSTCWMCPNQRNVQWAEMKRVYPEDFARACALERQIQERDPHAWLHESCRPLAEVEFDSQQEMFTTDRSCKTGHCFV